MTQRLSIQGMNKTVTAECHTARLIDLSLDCIRSTLPGDSDINPYYSNTGFPLVLAKLIT